MNLRPHHALCIQKFTGHGYDERFTEHMTEICEKLRNSPETVIYITSGSDELCAYCPNNSGGACSTPGKVEASLSKNLPYSHQLWYNRPRGERHGRMEQGRAA